MYRVELSNKAARHANFPRTFRTKSQRTVKPSRIIHARTSIRKRTVRIRSGDYRVVYEIQEDVSLVFVSKVGHRKDLYRK
ncbi:MAG: type II toxin-antitoxin system RelE/ParE family toxin [bacterium]